MKSEDVTIDPESKEIILDKQSLYCLTNILEIVYNAISKNVPTQLKITNLPPRRSGFRPLSEMINLEG